MSDQLKLSNQLCFPIYALSKEIISSYRPYLEILDLTYPQYLVMLVLWEENILKVKDIGDKLFLDSGTLTPLLKRLETKGIIERKRCTNDERNVYISLTNSGKDLKEKALEINTKLTEEFCITKDEFDFLKRIINNYNKTKKEKL